MTNHYFSFILLFCFHLFTVAQEEETLESNYEAHTDYPHEVAYAHVNKSILVQGEQLAFTAYVYDRNLKMPSFLTRNLYFQLVSEDDQVMEEAMLLVYNGVSEAVIDLDSTYTAGNYRMKLFTRWMKNQNDHPEFITELKILSNSTEPNQKNLAAKKSYDIQYFAEGGKLVESVKNTIGILVKDSEDRGVKLESGQLLANGELLAPFATNEMGMSRIFLTPQPNTYYSIRLNIEGENYEKNLTDIEPIGMSLSVNPLGNEVNITLSTNENSLAKFSDVYQIAIHDDKRMKIIEMPVENLSQTIFINKEDLSPGVNMVTVFDLDNQPILERTFFNYEKISVSNVMEVQARIIMDSINVELQLDKTLNYAEPSNVSLSIFPSSTQAIDKNNSLVTRFLIGSHIKGTVENPFYYFTSVDRRVMYDMDNLMITQGWTSYDWNDLLGADNKPKNSFDQGISFKAQLNSNALKQFLIYPLTNSSSAIVDLEEGIKYFTATELYAVEGDELRISGIDKKGKNVKPSLYPIFEPRTVPSYASEGSYLKLPKDKAIQDIEIGSFKQGAETLDAVVVSANKEKERFQKIIDRERGSVDVFDDKDRAKYFDLANYLSRRGGFNTSTADGIFTITSNSRGNGGPGSPSIIVDDVIYTDVSILVTLDPSIIDYVVINRDGIGDRVNNKFGVIKIYTNPLLATTNIEDNISTAYRVPLKFNKKRLYYRPEYNNYNGDFFNKIGIIHYLPNRTISTDGKVNFGFPNLLRKTYTVVIEGFTSDGTLISEIFEVKM
jgi:hypothetical protein